MKSVIYHLSYNVYKTFTTCLFKIWGPTPLPSLNGNRYYMSFVDAYSKFTWIFPINSKSDALSTFITLKHLVEKQLDASIKAIQTDWGGEFRSFTKFLSDNGIVHRLFVMPQ